MKVLVVFLLAVLGCSLTAGRIVAKCDLKDQLVKAIGNMKMKAKPDGLSVDDSVAKIVCHAEQVSGFNTSVVKELTSGKESNFSGEHKQQAEDHNNHPGNHSGLHQGRNEELNTHPGKENYHNGDNTGSNQPHSRHRRHDKGSSSPPTPRPAQSCSLYGVFQLSSCLACNGSVTPSANICGMDCSKLVDDNVNDDISCLLKILNLSDTGVGEKQLADINKLLVKGKCEAQKASVYFAGCQ